MSRRGDELAGTSTRWSVLGQLRPTPRIYALMLAMLAGAISIGAREVSRVRFATDAVGNELGVGLVAVLAALVVAVMSLFGGRLADSRNPRNLLIAGLGLSAITSGVTAWLLTLGTIPIWWLVTSAVLEGLSLGIGVPSLLKVQAAIVRPEARASAEVLNVLRSSLGAVIGTLLAGVIDNPPATLVACVCLLVIAMVGVALSANTRQSAPNIAALPIGDVLAAVRATPDLRLTIRVDLVLAMVLPSQFIALVLVDRDVGQLSSWAFTGSLLGGLCGRLVLTATGLGDRLVGRMRFSYLGFLGLCAVGLAALVDNWLLDRPLAVATILFAGTALSTFTYSIPGALIQQQVPDAIRGSLSGALAGARSLLIAASAGLLTVVTLVANAMTTVGTLIILLIGGFLVVGGFRGIANTSTAR